MDAGFYNTDPDMSDVPPKTASLHFVITQLKIARWLPNEKSGEPVAGGWTQRGANRLRWLADALRSSGIGDAKRASQWMKSQFSIGFFPPANDPGAESWLGCLEELGITSEADALTLVNLVAGECFPKCGKMNGKLVMDAATV